MKKVLLSAFVLALCFLVFPSSANAASRVTKTTLEIVESSDIAPGTVPLPTIGAMDDRWVVIHGVLQGCDSRGNVVWTYITKDVEDGSIPPFDEIGFYEDLFYFNEDGTIVALDRDTGKVRWKNADYGSVGQYCIDNDGSIYSVSDLNHSFYSIDSNGKTKILVGDLPDEYYNLNSFELLDDKIAEVIYYFGPAGDLEDNYYYINVSSGEHSPYLHGVIVSDFYDVPLKSWYADSVGWAVQEKIAAGTSNNMFSPEADCTTAQILTFLWRSVGSPEPSTSNPFSDVKTNDYYYKAALWAAEKKLISGNKFNGSQPCTRASTVTYLWKLSGSPNAGSTPFNDVASNSSYAKAVAWAVSNHITGGMDDNNFAPNQICNRAQIVTFLKRYASLKGGIAGSAWSTAYQRLIFSGNPSEYGIKSADPTSFGRDNVPIDYSLHDMDANGIPELIVYNGADSEAGAFFYAFTFSGDKIVNIGTLGWRMGAFNLIDNPKYPGLFRLNGNMGYYPGRYYYIKNGKIEEEDVLAVDENTNTIEKHTSDEALFNACINDLGDKLESRTADEIELYGWSRFCSSFGY